MTTPEYTENVLQVAVYQRSATVNHKQSASLAYHEEHYRSLISSHPKWKLAGIYTDIGTSGSSFKNRTAFSKMINDCREGKIDLIITRNIPGLSRNMSELHDLINELSSMQPPVGIFFENENLYTLDKGSELTFSFLYILATEESRLKSNYAYHSPGHDFHKGRYPEENITPDQE